MNIQTVSVLAVLWNGAYIYCQEAADPCGTFEEIPDLTRRHPNYTSSIGAISLDDEGNFNTSWYGNVHYRLSTKPPPLGRCGSRYPIWRDRNAKGTTATKAIMCTKTRESACTAKIHVLVKNCSAFEVYKLTQATVPYSSYCFEPTSSQDVPTFRPIPEITPYVEHTSSTKSDFRFRCEFNRSSKEELYYETDWFIDGKLFHKFDPMLWNDAYINNTVLTETLLLERGRRAGFNLQCAVRARKGPNLPSGPHKLSGEYFAGIKVPSAVYSLNLGEEAQVMIENLVPFGCGTSVADPDCSVTISVTQHEATNDPDKICKPTPVLAGSCTISPITAKQSSVSMTVMGQVVDVKDNYDSVSQFELVASSDKLPFFQNYTIGNVKVRLRSEMLSIETDSCFLDNDPYLYPFGSQKRIWSLTHYYGGLGVFTLYKHNVEPIEVQAEIVNCTIGTGSCTCGLAVRVGRTLFEISRCETDIWTRQHTSCGTEGEEVDVRRTDSNTYEIHLPTGGWIDVQIAELHLNVQLYPSARDVGNCSGLCGVFPHQSRELYIRKHGGPTSKIEEHFKSWSVERSSDDNLFTYRARTSWEKRYTPSRKYCTCVQHVNSSAQVVCSTMAATNMCSDISKKTPIKKARCSVTLGQRRLAFLRERNRRKREVARKWTQLEAEAHCDNLYARSATVDVCRDVPGVHVDRSKMQCVSDIMLSGTTMFANMSIESVRSPCIHEVAVNSTLHRKDPRQPSKPSVLETVMSRACPGDCTGRGSCHFGKCVCLAAYGGPDCSVDLSSPPELYTAEDGGHCDLTTSDCDELTVYGKTFTGSPNATCRIKKYKVTGNGVLKYQTMMSTETRDEGMNEMVCLLRPRVRRQVMPTPDADHVVTSYEISVSNTGDIFSDAAAVLVYDSTCVQIDEDTKQWTIKQGFCVVKSRCIPKAVAEKVGKCSEGTINTDNGLLPLWVCLGVLTLVVLFGLLICIALCNRRQGNKKKYTVNVLPCTKTATSN